MSPMPAPKPAPGIGPQGGRASGFVPLQVVLDGWPIRTYDAGHPIAAWAARQTRSPWQPKGGGLEQSRDLHGPGEQDPESVTLWGRKVRYL